MSSSNTETVNNHFTQKWMGYGKWIKAFALFFFLALILAGSSQAFAGTAVKVGKIKYTINENNKTAQCIGKAEKTENYIIIPASITVKGKEYKVTSIKDNAFQNDHYLMELSIGKNIETIGKNACSGCSPLELLVIQTKKLTDKTVGSNAFQNVGTNEYEENLDVNVPESCLPAYEKLLRKKGMTEAYQILTTNIGSLSYTITDKTKKRVQCTGIAPFKVGLRKTTIPSSVSINGKTYSVTSIKSVHDDLSNIMGGNHLKKVIISDGIEEIGTAAFVSCQSIEQLTIGKNVKSIGEWAFWGCVGLKSLTIKSDKLDTGTIGKKAFELINPDTHFHVPENKADAYRKLLQENGVTKKNQSLNGKSMECYSYSEPEYALFSLGNLGRWMDIDIARHSEDLLDTDSKAYSMGDTIPFSMRFEMQPDICGYWTSEKKTGGTYWQCGPCGMMFDSQDMLIMHQIIQSKMSSSCFGANYSGGTKREPFLAWNWTPDPAPCKVMLRVVLPDGLSYKKDSIKLVNAKREASKDEYHMEITGQELTITIDNIKTEPFYTTSKNSEDAWERNPMFVMFDAEMNSSIMPVNTASATFSFNYKGDERTIGLGEISVRTAAIRISNTDMPGNNLSGAEFDLYHMKTRYPEGSRYGTSDWELFKSGVHAGDTIIGLGAEKEDFENQYKLVQTKSPDGYEEAYDMEFELFISENGTVTAENEEGNALEVRNGVVQVNVVNDEKISGSGN